jgi:hypothetical protein
VGVLSHFLESDKADNIYDQKTHHLLDKIKEIHGIKIDRFQVSLYGRAADNLVEDMEKPSLLPSGTCRLPYWLGNEIHDPKAIEIDFNGNVTLCPGICIGNLKTQSLTNVLRNYAPEKHPFLHILAQEGPIGLTRMVTEFGIKINQRFVDECHLCYEMRQKLQRRFPSYLAPSSCYRTRTSRKTRNGSPWLHSFPPKHRPSKQWRWIPRVI